MLLQSYDFLHLYEPRAASCRRAAATSGATSPPGVELIRRVRGEQAYAMVYPLITKADGTKFGKTEVRFGLARSREDLAVPLLPVLAQHRRSRRGQVPEVLHLLTQDEIAALEQHGASAPKNAKPNTPWRGI